MMKKLLIILVFSCSILLTGFNTTDEREVTFLVRSMITAINEKDAEGYIQTLSDYFIKVTYGDKDFLRQNIENFGQIDLLEFKVVSINTYTSYAHYKLIHTSENYRKTTFFGEMILVKSNEGWKIYYVSEEELL
ncbi:hypothetical protein [Bacillus sp. OK048]|uniref:hypothetical protein n=1 Tax=Bacillus sp. OK048 TaxID=1882761 RepID=UPI001587A22A|nr:hypothetical protein [Bacillus sp. OK048]